MFLKGNTQKDIIVPAFTYKVDTGMKTVSLDFELEVKDFNGVIFEDFTAYITDKGTIGMLFIPPLGINKTFSITRKTNFDVAQVDSISDAGPKVNQMLQGLQDRAILFEAGRNLFDKTDSAPALRRAIFTIKSKIQALLRWGVHNSLIPFSFFKQPKNPPEGVPSDAPTIQAGDFKYLASYSTRHNDEINRDHQASGLSILPQYPDTHHTAIYTPVKMSLVDADGNYHLTLKKVLWDPRYEEKRAILVLANRVNSAIILAGPHKLTPGITETLGEVRLSVNGIGTLKPCNLAVILDGSAVPLEFEFQDYRTV